MRHAAIIWEETITASRGREYERGSGKYLVTIKLFSHDLQFGNLDSIADSGATLNCLCIDSPSDYEKRIEPIRALLPYGNNIKAHIQCQMRMDGIPEQSKTAYKFYNIQEPLMSIPVLCNNRYTFIFTKQSVHVNKDVRTILTGYREPATKL